MKISQAILSPTLRKLALSVVALTFTSHYASAVGVLTYDLRATSVVSGAGQIVDRKDVAGLDVGSVVQFDVVAVVSGTGSNAALDAYAFGFYAIQTFNANQAVLGNLGSTFTSGSSTSGVTQNTNWNSNIGVGQFGVDRNGDGGQDIGPASGNTAAANYALARSIAGGNGGAGTAGGLVFSGLNTQPLSAGFGISGVGQEWTIATVKFTVTGIVNAGNTTTINFLLPASLGVTVKANFQADGNATQNTVGVAGLAVNLVAVPEPATWAMLIGGMATLVGFQRFRRKA